VNRLKSQVAKYKAQIDSFNVPAPRDGIVVFMDVYKAEGQEPSRVQVGETRWRSGELLQIADMSEVLVRIPVNEVDIRSVAVGQKAAVRLLAYPERTYHGEVAKISSFAEDKNVKLGPLAVYRNGYAGVSVVDVFVRFLDADENVRLGSTAQVSIVTNRLNGVPTVPLTAVRSQNGTEYCWLADSEPPRRQPVKLGPANERDAVLLSGLAEGDRILDHVYQLQIRD